jgi:parvulin-like peptidyl-prolyl isomerase
MIRRLFVVIMATVVLSACGTQVIPGQLAVNGHAVPISLYRSIVKAEQQKIERTGVGVDWHSSTGQHRLAAIQSSVIRQLVRSTVIEQLAQARGITVSRAELTAAVSGAERAMGGPRAFEIALEQAGISRPDFAAVLRYRLLEARLRQTEGTGFTAALERAMAGARVVATIAPCGPDRDYPACLTDRK